MNKHLADQHVSARVGANAQAALHKTAKLIRKLPDYGAEQYLYRLSEPLGGFDFVVVSATTVAAGSFAAICDDFIALAVALGIPPPPGAAQGTRPGDETYIFGSDADGKVTNFRELNGSFKGARDHARALAGAGYSIAEASHG